MFNTALLNFFSVQKSFYFCSFSIDATTDDGSFGRLINHSRLNSNLKAKSIQIDNSLFVYFVANKDININDELLYDYGDRRKECLLSYPWLKK